MRPFATSTISALRSSRTTRLAPRVVPSSSFHSSASRLKDSGLTNLFDDTARPRVAVTKLNDQGFVLSDGLIVPGGVIFVDNRIFLWDVDPPKVDNLTGRGIWDDWKEDRLSVFETVLPRPGERLQHWEADALN